MQVIVWALSTASAGPVVWMAPPTPADEAVVISLPGAEGRLTPLEVVAAGIDGQALDDAYRRLEDTLRAVRQYETKLDGELIIMTDLQAAIEQITGVRDDSDRERLFKALAYQGFAIDRYFAETLATDPAAEPWRTDVDGTPTVGPWVAAAALHPTRAISTYDISETPQRIAYEAVQKRVVDALPGGLRTDVDKAHTLWVDGEQVDATGTVRRLPPGPHYVELRQGDTPLARQRVVLTPGGATAIELDWSVSDLAAFVAALPDAEVPAPLRERLDDLGGDLLFAVPEADATPVIWSVDASGIRRVPVMPPVSERSERASGLSFGGSLQAGWLASADFYTSAHDVAPNTAATVNSLALGAGVDVSFDAGLFRAGLGVDAVLTPGSHHVARSGETGFRVRPAPHAFVGTRYGGVTAGYVVPYHPFVGARASAPLTPGLSLTGDARVGLPGTFTRPDAPPYQTSPLFSVVGGATFRLHP